MEINFKPRAGVGSDGAAFTSRPATALRVSARELGGAGFIVGLLFSLVFLGAGCAMLWSFATGSREIPLLIIGGVFTVVGGAMTVASLRTLADRIRHGNVLLQVSQPVPVAGGSLVAWMALPEKAAAAGYVTVEFNCLRIRYVKERSGGKSQMRRDEKSLWSTRAQVPVSGRRADIRFDIPDGLPAATREPERTRFISVDDPPRYEWVVHVVADIPGVDLDRNYLVPVGAGKTPVAAETPAAPAPRPAQAAVMPAAGAVPAPATTPSLAILVLGNLPPLAGVMFWGWNVGDVVLVYWLENVIIGAINILRLLTSTGSTEDVTAGPVGTFASRLFLAGFFSVHYGMFCYVHGIFIVSFFGDEALRAFGHDLVGAVSSVLSDRMFAVAIAGLAVSHLFSYFHNFLGRGEGRHADPRMIMIRPYGRIVVVHLFILAGAALASAFGSQAIVMMLFVVLKVTVDGIFHLKERKALGARP